MFLSGCMSDSADNSGSQDGDGNPETDGSDSGSQEGSSGTTGPELEWEASAGARIGNGYHFPQPTLLDSTLVVAAGLNQSGVLKGYDSETGGDEWELSTKTSMSSHHPLPSNGSVVVVPTDSGISAISGSGETQWSKELHLAGDMMAAGDRVILPKSDGIEARSFEGDELWTWDSDSSVRYVGGGEDTLYARLENEFIAIDATEGQTEWRFQSQIEPSVPPVVTNDLLIIGDGDGQITAIYLDSQEEAWSVNLGNEITTPISHGESYIYAAGWSEPLHALDPDDGSTVWTFNPQYQTVSPVVEAGESVYVSSDTGDLYSRHRETGDSRWSYELDSASMAAPLIHESKMFVSTDEGAIYHLLLPTQ